MRVWHSAGLTLQQEKKRIHAKNLHSLYIPLISEPFNSPMISSLPKRQTHHPPKCGKQNTRQPNFSANLLSIYWISIGRQQQKPLTITYNKGIISVRKTKTILNTNRTRPKS